MLARFRGRDAECHPFQPRVFTRLGPLRSPFLLLCSHERARVTFLYINDDVSRTVADHAASQSGLDSGVLRKMLLAMAVTGFMGKQAGGGEAATHTSGARQSALDQPVNE